MDETSKAPVTGHVYPAGHQVFEGPETEEIYRHRNANLVAALRSGQFTQAKGALQRLEWDNLLPRVIGHCCLGVACVVAQVDGVSVAPINRYSNYSSVWAVADGDQWEIFTSEVAPTIVQEYFGWENPDPFLYHEAESDGYTARLQAAARNDSGESFGKIADGFERTFVTFTYEESPAPSTVSPAPSTVDDNDELPDYLD